MEPPTAGMNATEDDADFGNSFADPDYFLHPTGYHGLDTNIAERDIGVGSTGDEVDGAFGQVSTSFYRVNGCRRTPVGQNSH